MTSEKLKQPRRNRIDVLIECIETNSPPLKFIDAMPSKLGPRLSDSEILDRVDFVNPCGESGDALEMVETLRGEGYLLCRWPDGARAGLQRSNCYNANSIKAAYNIAREILEHNFSAIRQLREGLA